jgi:asparagine synthetase B (glutamine-hydrolysing)
MCGIAGWLLDSLELCEVAGLRRMLAAIGHRGPHDTELCRSRRGCSPERHRIREGPALPTKDLAR